MKHCHSSSGDFDGQMSSISHEILEEYSARHEKHLSVSNFIFNGWIVGSVVGDLTLKLLFDVFFFKKNY